MGKRGRSERHGVRKSKSTKPLASLECGRVSSLRTPLRWSKLRRTTCRQHVQLTKINQSRRAEKRSLQLMLAIYTRRLAC